METWIAIGGSGQTQSAWSDMVSTQETRAVFIDSLSDFMDKWGFQGADLDWEYPGLASGGKATDGENFVALVQEMRAAFRDNWGISCTLPPNFSDLSNYDPNAMSPYMDFFNFMAYDLHGPWEINTTSLAATIQPQTDIRDISNDSLPFWYDSINPSKINLGIAYYGRGYTSLNTSCVDIGCQYTGPSIAGNCTNTAGVLSLREIEIMINTTGRVPKLVQDAMVKELSWGDQWIGYDDEETIGLKMNWANENCLGGTVIWSIDFDSGAGRNGQIRLRIH
ncbi:hypothetical protein B7494_g366 [Chlorociboria aeruginascens]|nr:hypothetical protein B7494_g366 [Chlorociboria aeruginascens]